MSRPQGIDISNNNGPNFDWESWRNEIQFAMIKVTESTTFKDPDLGRNWLAAAKLDVYRFGYHFGNPAKDPGEQAHFFVSTLADHGISRWDNFALDIERTGGMHPIDVSFWAWTFMHEVNRMRPGHRTMCYTDPAFANAGNVAKCGTHPLWIANFGVASPQVPPPWKHWTFWQYSATVTDRDVFNGTQHELDKFCRND